MDEYQLFEEKKYNDTYDLMYYTTMNQLNNGLLNLADVEALLRDQYVFCDLDWLGRGEIKNIINQANIAALETILFELREEQKKII